MSRAPSYNRRPSMVSMSAVQQAEGTAFSSCLPRLALIKADSCCFAGVRSQRRRRGRLGGLSQGRLVPGREQVAHKAAARGPQQGKRNFPRSARMPSRSCPSHYSHPFLFWVESCVMPIIPCCCCCRCCTDCGGRAQRRPGAQAQEQCGDGVPARHGTPAAARATHGRNRGALYVVTLPSLLLLCFCLLAAAHCLA